MIKHNLRFESSKKSKKTLQLSLLLYARMTVKLVSMDLFANMLLQYVTRNSDERLSDELESIQNGNRDPQ